MGELRDLTTKVARWNAVLVRLALNEPDPLLRFRNHYAAGDYRQALAALAKQPTDPDDVGRYAHCLAETGDVAGYRTFLHDRLPRPDTTVVRVQVAGTPAAVGFLVQNTLVVTSRPAVTEPADVTVHTEHGVRTVTRVHLPDAPDHDVAVLRLTDPVDAEPPRLGYPRLVRVGDQVQTPGGTPTTGLVDRFESLSGARLFHTGLRVPHTGGPVLNDLGEVIGVITNTDDTGAHVLSIDALDPLLTEAGFDRHG